MLKLDEAIKENDAAWEQAMFMLIHCPEKENYKYIGWTIQLCQLKNRLMEKKNAGNIQS